MDVVSIPPPLTTARTHPSTEAARKRSSSRPGQGRGHHRRARVTSRSSKHKHHVISNASAHELPRAFAKVATRRSARHCLRTTIPPTRRPAPAGLPPGPPRAGRRRSPDFPPRPRARPSVALFIPELKASSRARDTCPVPRLRGGSDLRASRATTVDELNAASRGGGRRPIQGVSIH